MTRFVRIYHDPKDDPGSRIRVEYDPDDTGAFIVADENVLPEETYNPDARRVQALGNINLDHGTVLWMRDTFIELCKHLDEEERAIREAADLEARAIVAAEHGVPLSAVHVLGAGVELLNRCPHGNMPREAGAGHWREWHRGHGCHLDPSKKGTP